MTLMARVDLFVFLAVPSLEADVDRKSMAVNGGAFIDVCLIFA